MSEARTWFKAVRPDLSSFRDETFVYRVGGIHRPRTPANGGYETCTDLVLHASPTPPQATRFNAQWPWRILEVTGKPVVDDGPKVGFRQLKVIQEVDVARSFGPNGSAVLKIVERCERLTINETLELADAWDAAGGAAWAAAGGAARTDAWDAAWDAAKTAATMSVADLVGQHGLGQHHIDTLTAPWRQVIGDT